MNCTTDQRSATDSFRMSTVDRRAPVDPFRIPIESLELAGYLLDGFINMDNMFPSFLDVTRLSIENRCPTVSGHTDSDYPHVDDLAGMTQMNTVNKIPLPQEVMDHFNHMQCHYTMGLFTDISRAWLTIDSDIFVWTYEKGNDIAYFDGLGETIVNVCLVKPKPGIFNNLVKYLLILTTTIEVVVLGVTFTSTQDGQLGGLEEMHLLPDPVFVIPTDGVVISSSASTCCGRIFLGGKDGCLYEILYQAGSGWFGKRYKKVNHSRGTLSYLVPSFLSYPFRTEDPITQISIDNSRHILFTLTEGGTIDVYDMGDRGDMMCHVGSLSESQMVQNASQFVPYLESKIFMSIIQVCAVEAYESPYLNFVVVTKSGVRLYYTTSYISNFTVRPSSIYLLHIRLPPGFSASTLINKPGSIVRAHYSKGSIVMISTPREDKANEDILWCLSSDSYPFRPFLAELQSAIGLGGNVWALEEMKPNMIFSVLSCVKCPNLQGIAAEPPLIVRQHMEPPRRYVLLTSQGVEILVKLRPVDLLRQLLQENHGPDNKAVKAYFREQREDQACATCLILACLDSTQNVQLADWARRAIFMYGMEPVNPTEAPVVATPSAHQYSMHGGFSPGVVSTPLPGNQQHPAAQIPFSPSITSPPSVVPPQSPLPQQTYTSPFRSPPCPRFQDGSIRMEDPIYPQLLHESSLAQQQQQQFATPVRQQQQSLAQPSQQPAAQPQLVSPGMCPGYTAKHNGLYLYLGRILGPIWNLPVVQKADNSKPLLLSLLSREDCVFILGHLLALKTFLEKNPQYSVVPMQANAVTVTMKKPTQDGFETPVQVRGRTVYTQNVTSEEKQSLDAFKVLVSHVCEVMGLWKILCEHQFHLVAGTLNENQQSELRSGTFRTLILAGHELCSVLINSLISCYLNDDASVDAISAKLREVCPHLYRNEDAACSKANEMLLSARSIQNPTDKQAKLVGALELCKNVAPQVNLPLICQWFASSQYYEGILELCMICAAKLDPHDMALHYYNNKQPPGDEEGYRAYVERMQCYKEITSALDQLYVKSISSPCTPMVPGSPGRKVVAEPSQNFLSPADSDHKAKKLIETALNSGDDLLHIAIYEWMFSRQLLGELQLNSQPTYEKFLKRKAENNPNAASLYDYLWKYYEKNDNHAEAAKVLAKIARVPGNQVTLSERIACLAHAGMCLRSVKAGCAPPLGVFLRELEDLLEVARLQLQILDAINAKPETIQTREAIIKLNAGLVDITDLYQNYAEPYQLWECKLAIIHCSGHHDPKLVEHIWVSLLEGELQSCVGYSANAKMSTVMLKVKAICEEYNFLPRCVPFPFLLRELELLCCRIGADAKQVHPPLLSAGFPMFKLLQTYEGFFTFRDNCWLRAGSEFHPYEVVGHMIESFLDNPKAIASSERHLVATKAEDVLTSAMLEVMSKTGAEQVTEFLTGVKARLSRLQKRM